VLEWQLVKGLRVLTLSSMIKLVEFVHKYDKAVAARHRAESQDDFQCLNCVPQLFNKSIRDTSFKVLY